jgi:Fe-S-cluster containining protein
MDTFWLSTHRSYHCRHSGACCTARWPIPIERDRASAVQAAIDAGRLHAPLDWYRSALDAPADVAGVLALQPSGACVFHRPGTSTGGSSPAGGCTIHPTRPASCEHFPYVCVIDPRGVHVTLSHVCPTAAALLFDIDAPVGIVAGPPIVPEGCVPEGLDAREALPPAKDGGRRLWTWDEVAAWEEWCVMRLASDTRVPEPPDPADYDRVRAAAPPEWTWPEAPQGLEGGWLEVVAPGWPRWAGVIGRYLAAKAHASWAMYLGDGPRDVERMVGLARTVLQVEAVRQCRVRGHGLDRATLTESIRQSDLLLLHHADPAHLCASGMRSGASQ